MTSTSTLIPSTPSSPARSTRPTTTFARRVSAVAPAPKSRLLRAEPKLVKTSSTRVPRSWASRMSCRPIGPVICLYPFWPVSIVPFVRFVTENRARVVSSVPATWAVIVGSISQYGRKP